MENMASVPDARRVRLRERLLGVAALIGYGNVVADIGCDHGRLAVALLQSGKANKVIAADISRDSLEKARRLCEYIGLGERMETRLGDGLQVLYEGEADVIAVCGMGGLLIVDMLKAAKVPLMGAERAVLQPMRGAAELRKYVCKNGYCIDGEKIAKEGGRFYEAVSISIGEEAAFPKGWPVGCYEVGVHAVEEPLFPEYLHYLRAKYETRLQQAEGSRGEGALRKKLKELLQIQNFMEQRRSVCN